MEKYFIVARKAAISAIRANGSSYIAPSFPGRGYNRPMTGGYSEGPGPQIVNPFREEWVDATVWQHCVEALASARLCVMDAAVEGLRHVEVVWSPHWGAHFEACLRLAK